MSDQFLSENRIWLRTSQFSCFFEPKTGFLRQVMVEGCEIVRAIYGAVRDQNWNTVQPEIVVSGIETTDNYFRLQFQVECTADEIAFRWDGTIEGRAGTLSFKFAGEAKSTFKKNRIGLCLLHPIHGCAGRKCRVHRTDNSWVESEFPLFIAPHQPFKDLGSLSWKPSPDLEASVTFGGEVFETEDQRNWTDASFKTYCTPLERPFPAEIEAGATVDQWITIEFGRIAQLEVADGTGQELIFVSAKEEKALPSLGVSSSDCDKPLVAAERALLADLHLNHLRMDVRFNDPRWRESLERATADAKAIGARLQPALFLSGLEDLRAFVRAVDHQMLHGCLIFHRDESTTSDQWLGFASQSLPGVTVVGGTNSYFTELNRQRPTARFPAAFSLNPQVHAFDDLSLIENLEGQPETIHSARQFCASGLYISPITLRPRSNPNATTRTLEPPDRLPSSVDTRQRTLFGAAWTAGSLAQLLPAPGIESLTYFEMIGWKGLIEAEQGNLLPDQFKSKPGEIFPVYHVFHALAEAKALLAVTNPIPQKIAAIGFRKHGSTHVLLANLQSETTVAKLRLPVGRLEVQVLSEMNLAAASQGILPNPDVLLLPRGEAAVELPSYSLAFLRCI